MECDGERVCVTLCLALTNFQFSKLTNVLRLLLRPEDLDVIIDTVKSLHRDNLVPRPFPKVLRDHMPVGGVRGECFDAGTAMRIDEVLVV